jgi:hypothetical protein
LFWHIARFSFALQLPANGAFVTGEFSCDCTSRLVLLLPVTRKSTSSTSSPASAPLSTTTIRMRVSLPRPCSPSRV